MRHQIWTFLRLVWGEWASRVTGSLSAILLLLGLVISIAGAFGVRVPADSIIQFAIWILAAICGGQAAYSVWARERVARDQAEAQLVAFRDTRNTPHESGTQLAFRGLKEKSARQFLGLEVRSDALQMSLGTTADFEQIEDRGGCILRTILVCVENIDPSHFISNCKLHAEFDGRNNLLVDNFTLNATERRFVPIVTHHESPSDKFIHIQAPHVSGFFAEAYDHLKIPLSGGLITLNATSAETRPARLPCRAFIDSAGKLKMEKA